ncbi:hypothetical protein Tco_1101313 [Tanacetum coccineum]
MLTLLLSSNGRLHRPCGCEEEGIMPAFIRGTSKSAPLHGSSLGVTDYQVSSLVLSGDEGSATQPPIVQAHDDLFDTSVLDGAGGA